MDFFRLCFCFCWRGYIKYRYTDKTIQVTATAD